MRAGDVSTELVRSVPSKIPYLALGFGQEPEDVKDSEDEEAKEENVCTERDLLEHD